MKNWIGIPLGDVTGVGPEVTLKAIAAEAAADDTRYLLLGDPDCARRLNAALGLNLPLKDFSRYDDPGKFFITNPQAGSLPEKLPAGSLRVDGCHGLSGANHLIQLKPTGQ